MTRLAALVAYEAATLLRTRRAAITLGLYVALAALATLVYAGILGSLQDGTASLRMEGDAGSALDLAAQSMSDSVLGWLGGIPARHVHPWLRSGPVVPFVFWASLAFLPWLTLLAGFDSVLADLRDRTLCYFVPRARRDEVLLAKALAQLGLFVVGLLGSVAVMSAVALWRLPNVDLAGAVPGLAWACVLLPIYGAACVAFVILVSTLARSSFGALGLALGLGLLFSVAGWLGEGDEPWRVVPRALSMASVSGHRALLWHQRDFIWGLLVYAGLALVFFGVARWRLGREDL